ncbi:MAG: GNAT family N-acetyltransferase [Pseudomonadales bacterium]|nr:GNAT family N-acetyltransferase [Pseudomonadales bacterium]
MPTTNKCSIRVLQSLADISAAEWDSCANPVSQTYNPFLAHSFLTALEDSHSVGPESGWQTFHLVLEATPEDESSSPQGATEICGILPLYLKGHSQGEYVFDYAWADAWHRAGQNYYPKMQCSIPFTPATGRRLLIPDGQNIEQVQKQLLAGAVQIAEEMDLSSLHFTFLPKVQWELLGEMGLLQRMDQQYHWENQNYGNFDDFLNALASKKRKNIKRERKQAVENNIIIEKLRGAQILEEHWDAFYKFYMDTGNRKWGTPYLTREFFSLVTESMSDSILLILCQRDGQYIAGALNFIGSDTLYGRNWGCIEHHRFLHFEICYYQAIEYAIQHRLKYVEAGAQGAHKIARGYVPRPTYSAHWIKDQNFRAAVADYLKEERSHVQADIEHLSQHIPFKRQL